MSEVNKPAKLSIGAGLVAAIASSLCCIGPLITGVAGLSGAAANFTWMDPLRPYLIGFTVLTLGFAFFQAYKPVAVEADCCTPEVKKAFYQSKGFLWSITFISALLLSFPYYSDAFYSTPERTEIPVNTNTAYIYFEVEGMTCTGCENHIESDLTKVDGILFADAKYDEAGTEVQFDPKKISKEEIVELINHTGYTVTNERESNGE